jgi:hypothetical protein
MANHTNLRQPTLGDNLPQGSYAQAISGQLASDYAELVVNADDQINRAAELPSECTDESGLEAFTDIVVKLRDISKRTEAMRIAEKEPHLRASQAVDRFFDAIKQRIAAALAPIQNAVNSYNLMKAARERLHLQREAEAKRKVEEAARAEADARNRTALEAARKAEVAKRNREEAIERSLDANAAAEVAQAQAMVAKDELERANIDAAKRTSDLTRQRFENTGRLVTARQVGFAEIINESALDLAVLGPFIPLKAKEQALRAWAKATSYKVQMPGASVGLRNETVIR